MASPISFASLLGSLIVLAAAPAAAQNRMLSVNAPTMVNGVETVCTGVGETDRSDPRWASYPAKVELVGKGGEYLGNAQISLSKAGKTLINIGCAGPWALFKLKPGRYDVNATTGGETKKGVIYAQAKGQGLLILRFLETKPQAVSAR